MDSIQKISIEDPSYPKSLREIKDAPKTLYYRGTLPTDEEICFAIVGTRRNSAYGQQVATSIAAELTEAGVTVVSGLAPGIDTFAHQAVVEKKKRTIAVLGTGLDEKSLYPKTNLALSRNILTYGGCLISELPEGQNGSKFSFPKRNRIISALSKGVLVVEAKEKSGSLITARYATQQHKKLFAVPGQIYALNSTGPNKLIKEGAMLTENTNDILKELGISQKIIQINIAAENNEEALILEALIEESLYIDAIIEKTKLQASLVSTTLAIMEISGKIRSLGGNTYSLN